MEHDFSGKRVLITGAAGGIGSALVSLFQEAGAAVAASDIDASGVDCDFNFSGDLMDGTYCDRLPLEASEAMGGLDIVLNNAGIITRGKVTETSDDDFSRSVAVNVEAPFRICRAAIPIMAKSGGGAIVNTASCWGVYPGPGHAVYCMTKAALASLTQCMGKDHASEGIRVNAVCPNEVDTPMLRSGFEKRGFDPQSAIADLGETVPLGRVASPDDIADVIAFLASDQSRYMCGALVEVNGGKAVM